jgi:hypothetical protein
MGTPPDWHGRPGGRPIGLGRSHTPADPAAAKHGPGSLPGMETPPPDPEKLLAHWMEWERGETPPGRVMSTLKTGGLRQLLESLVNQTAGSGAESGT